MDITPTLSKISSENIPTTSAPPINDKNKVSVLNEKAFFKLNKDKYQEIKIILNNSFIQKKTN